MSRAFDITLVGVIYVIAAVIHRMGTELFAPGKPLYKLATDGTGNMDGTALASQWFEILTVWMPLLVVGGITLYAVVREYKRQVQTAARRRPG